MAFDRRRFLAAGGAGFIVAGLYSGNGAVVDVPRPIKPAADETDAALFARVRERFLFPTDITYGNRGSLGACSRHVMDVYLGDLEKLEQ